MLWEGRVSARAALAPAVYVAGSYFSLRTLPGSQGLGALRRGARDPVPTSGRQNCVEKNGTILDIIHPPQ
eukprot:3535456-Pyramimonas_sp.AAC.1